ncbi:MAG: vWA domain-containing protein [Gaiellaceae bacterium]
MTDVPIFGVDTIELDLPPLASAFSRRLHERGVPVTPARAAYFAHALTLVRPVARRRLYWTARGVFVTDPVQVPPFDEVFLAVFGTGVEAAAADEQREPPRDEPGRSGRSVAPRREGEGDSPGIDVPRVLASDEERLSRKHFDALEPAELAQLHRLMSKLELATPLRRTRRYERGRHGGQVDLRRTLRGSLRTNGDPIRLARRRRRSTRRRLVLLCDVSGSMEPYARAYLQFLTSAAGSGRRAEVFVFATRLTRITRALAARNPERAIERAARAVPDWSSGTRIGEALAEFNDRHGRRGLARGAVVVILSDGWERGDPRLVAREMERLARLAHRIVWVNPRVAAGGFSARSGGMAAALPFCDALVSGHNFEALAEVVAAIGTKSWEPPAAPPPDAEADDEPWASAMPVPGSSVAMPSGYGPSRGKTTPGWAVHE